MTPRLTKRMLRRPCAAAAFAIVVAGCGDDVDVRTNPGGEVSTTGTCPVRVRYAEATPAESLLIFVDYSDVTGTFGERGVARNCRPVLGDIQTAILTNWCEDDCSNGERRSLQMELFTGQDNDGNEIVGPADVVRCDFEGDPSTLDRLVVTQTNVLTGVGNGSNPRVELIADCDDAAPATTTTTSSSTTSTTLCEGDECPIILTASLDLDTAVSLGSLQVELTYACTAGVFEHLPRSPWVINDVVRCGRGDLAVDLWATAEYTVDEGDPASCRRVATFAAITNRSMDGPGTLLRCPFHAERADLDGGEFSVRIVDATDPSVFALPMADVTSVSVRLENASGN